LTPGPSQYRDGPKKTVFTIINITNIITITIKAIYIARDR